MDLNLFPLECNSGPEAMATDEHLLNLANQGGPLLRFYTWKEPTVSLGYFQPCKLLTENAGLKNLSWVRRQTGGEALVHHHELTYCLAIPASLIGLRPSLWQSIMHQAILESLERLGFGRGAMDSAGQRLDPTGLLCFLHHTPLDLVFQGHKIAGSAQRKTRKGIMQHGGILLNKSPHAPELLGLCDLSKKEIDIRILGESVSQKLCALQGWSMTYIPWGPGDKSAIKLLEAKYASPEWNCKR